MGDGLIRGRDGLVKLVRAPALNYPFPIPSTTVGERLATLVHTNVPFHTASWPL